MGSLSNYLVLIVDFAGGVLVMLLLLRFHVSSSPYETTRVYGGLCTATNWLVAPISKISGRVWGMELAALLAALLVAVLQEFAIHYLHGYKLLAQPSVSIPVLSARGALQVLLVVCNLYILVLVAGVVLSWLQLRNPASQMVMYFNSNLLYPFRKFIRPLKGIDLSPAVALLVLLLISSAVFDAINRLDRIF